MESKSTQYEKIGERYTSIVYSGNDVIDCIFVPSLLTLLGELKNESVLDVGCGNGHFTRIFKR